jgi:CheY-like chemotaxis protein
MSTQESSAAGARILIVDDNVDAAETLQMLLAIAGYDARTAYDGAAALEIARELSPEIVLCDIGLPGKDGYQVARELRELPETRSALLVALTGYGHEEGRRRASQAGFDAFQVKPVEPDALHALLAEHFARRGA